jgi:hypothetical protein
MFESLETNESLVELSLANTSLSDTAASLLAKALGFKKKFFPLSSVVDPEPDPQGSETFCRIRNRIWNSRLWIWIRNWTYTLPKYKKNISYLIIMTLKIRLSYIFIEKDALKCH